MHRRLLVLAPHADDAEFGLGAFIARATDAGDKVTVLIAAFGNYERGSVFVDGGKREGEARKALKHLGVSDVRFGHWFEENKALTANYGLLVSRIEELLNEFDDIYVSLPSFNQDHRALYDAFVTATRPGMTWANLYAYEYPGNAWGPSLPLTGKKYLQASRSHAERKIEALNMHESQFKERFAAVGPEAAETLLRQRGAEIGRYGAELVYVLREFG